MFGRGFGFRIAECTENTEFAEKTVASRITEFAEYTENAVKMAAIDRLA